MPESVQWCVTSKDVPWLYLTDRTVLPFLGILDSFILGSSSTQAETSGSNSCVATPCFGVWNVPVGCKIDSDVWKMAKGMKKIHFCEEFSGQVGQSLL